MTYPTNINWYPVPFVRMLIFFSIGIVCSIYSDWITFVDCCIVPSLFLSVVLALKVKSYKWRWSVGVSLHITLFFIGYLLTYQSLEINQASHYSRQVMLSPDQYVFVTAVVDNQPNLSKYIKTELVVRSIGTNTTDMRDCSGKLLLYIENDSGNTRINYGDQIVAKLKITKPRSPMNTYDFDFSKYLFFQNIHFQSYAKTAQWKKVDGRRGQRVWHLLYDWRLFLVSILKRNITSTNEQTVAEALIIGYRDEIPDEITQAYVDTGAMHVLSVSGLHVGIVAMALEKILGFRKVKRKKWNRAILVAAIWLFALLSGASASVLRAAVMFSILIIGKSYSKNVNIYNILSVSAFILLTYRPLLLFDIGFQLSYLGLFGILFFQPKLEKIWMPDNWLLWKFWQFTSTGIAAQITTLPISIYAFHQFPIYFWLSGLVVIPASTIILYGGIALFASAWIPGLPHLIGSILTKVIWLTNNSLLLIQRLPYSVLEDIWFQLPQVILMFSCLVFVVTGISLRRYKLLQLAGFSLLLSIIPFTSKTWQEVQQKKIAVHLLKHGGSVDFISGKKASSVHWGTIDEKSKKYIIGHCRSYLGIAANHVNPVIDSCHNDNIAQKGPFIQFENKLIFLGDSYCRHPVRADFAIFYENFDLDTLHCNIAAATIILHPSLTRRIKEKCIRYFGSKAKIIAPEQPGTILLDLKTPS